MDVKARDASLKEFREDGNVRVLLMSLKAGGVALNLTVANHIYLMDPWYVAERVLCKCNAALHLKSLTYFLCSAGGIQLPRCKQSIVPIVLVRHCFYVAVHLIIVLLIHRCLF